MNTFLVHIKDLLGIPSEVKEFDNQLVLYINMTLSVLSQLGLGPKEPYQTTLNEGSLDDFLPDDEGIHASVMIYIYNKVRLMFDPPTSAFVLKSLETVINEYEWRFSCYLREEENG